VFATDTERERHGKEKYLGNGKEERREGMKTRSKKY